MTRTQLILLPLLTILTACQTLGEHKRADALEDVLRRYEASIRWTSGRQAHNFMPPQEDPTQDQREIRPASKNVRVTHYEVVQGPTMLGETRAVQTAVIQYVLQDTQIVRELSDQQEWRYDEEAEMWHLHSPVPVFK